MTIFLLDDNPQDLLHLQDEVSRLFPHEESTANTAAMTSDPPLPRS